MENDKQFIKKEIPIGTGRESEPKETLPAVEVDNEVIWINPDFPELPFNLKEGEPTKLGVFLTPQPKEGEKTIDLKASGQHTRSALLGRAIFKDKQNRFYRDVDLKGMGNISPGQVRVRSIADMGNYEQSWGILNLDWAKYSAEMSEKFTDLGIRTERYLALIKLNEIVDKNGDRISIDEATKKELIPSNVKPCIALRALGTKFRVEDIEAAKDKKGAVLLDDAKKLIAQELGFKKEKFSMNNYLEWFAKTAGENLSLIHKNGWCHKYLTSHNITLDCRIVDLDSVVQEKGSRDNDYWRLCDTISSLYFYYKYYKYRGEIHGKGQALFQADKFRKKMEDIFKDAYVKTLGYKPEFLEGH